MSFQCRCGSPLDYRLYEVACIECGAPCCPSCTLILEAATYCVRCAESILEIPAAGPRDEA